MPSIRISKELNSQIYFLTFTVKDWCRVLDRYDRFEILSDSIEYCRKHKGLMVYAYVFMPNHIHLVVFAPDMIAFVRDFKRYTASKIIEDMYHTEPDLLELFKNENRFELWRKTNMPKLIESEKYLLQKINYIHNNPVRKQYVQRSEQWYWSSANPDSPIKVEII